MTLRQILLKVLWVALWTTGLVMQQFIHGWNAREQKEDFSECILAFVFLLRLDAQANMREQIKNHKAFPYVFLEVMSRWSYASLTKHNWGTHKSSRDIQIRKGQTGQSWKVEFEKNQIHNPPNKPVCIKQPLSVTPSCAGWRRRPSTLSDRAAEAKPGGELVAVRRDDAAAEFLRAWRGTHEAEEAEADDETGVKHGALLITVSHWQAHYS